MKPRNNFRIKGDVVWIQLGGRARKETCIDLADWPEVQKYRWTANRDGDHYYAVRTHKPEKGWRLQFLHRFLESQGDVVDHLDGNQLNNRRNNLRPSSYRDNNRNAVKRRLTASSKFKGVSCSSGKIRATVVLGTFETEEAAAHAYDSALRRLCIPFARFNFPLPGEQPALREDNVIINQELENN